MTLRADCTCHILDAPPCPVHGTVTTLGELAPCDHDECSLLRCSRPAAQDTADGVLARMEKRLAELDSTQQTEPTAYRPLASAAIAEVRRQKEEIERWRANNNALVFVNGCQQGELSRLRAQASADLAEIAHLNAQIDRLRGDAEKRSGIIADLSRRVEELEARLRAAAPDALLREAREAITDVLDYNSRVPPELLLPELHRYKLDRIRHKLDAAIEAAGQPTDKTKS